MRKTICALAAMAAMGSVTTAFADKVEFTNGDVLTGKITQSDGKKLTIATEKAGEVKVDLANVKTFSTDEPIEFRLSDGTTLKQRAIAAEPGSVATERGDVVQSQSFRLDTIRAINPPPLAWHGSVTLGAQISRGNTYSDRMVAGFDLIRRAEDDRFTASGTYSYGRDKDPETGIAITSVDNWQLNGKLDHFYTPKWYVFVNALVAKDRIQDLNLRFVPGVGVGYQWVERPDFNFNTEAGLSWLYEDYDTQSDRQEIALRLAYHLDKKLNDKLKFIHNLEFIPSIEDPSTFLVNADVGIRADVTANFFLEAKIEDKYNSDPAPGRQKTDLKYTLGVGWKF